MKLKKCPKCGSNKVIRLTQCMGSPQRDYCTECKMYRDTIESQSI